MKSVIETFFIITAILEPLPISSSAIRPFILDLLFINIHGYASSMLRFIDFMAHGLVGIITLLFFRKRVMLLCKALIRNDQRFISLGLALTITFLCTVGAYGIKQFLYFNGNVSYGLSVTVILLAIQWYITRGHCTQVKIYHGFFWGMAQGLALLIPGVSRLGLLYTILRLQGYTTRISFEIAWLTIIPLYFGAGLYGLCAYEYHFGTQTIFFQPLLMCILSAGVGIYIFLIVAWRSALHYCWFVFMPIPIAAIIYYIFFNT